MTRAVVSVALLAVVYTATLASDDPLDVATGALLGGVVLAISHRWTTRLGVLGSRPAPSTLRRALAAVPFAGAVAWEVALGTWQVALIASGLRPLRSPGLLELPIGERSERGVAVFAMAVGLSPGTVLLEVDDDRGVLVLHAIDASDPDVLRARLDRLYTRWQRPVVP
jgi:multicomponent Na+:H+ antiporter subunit E